MEGLLCCSARRLISGTIQLSWLLYHGATHVCETAWQRIFIEMKFKEKSQQIIISVGHRGSNASKAFHMRVSEMVFGMKAGLSLARGDLKNLIQCYVISLDACMVQSC